MSGFLFSGIEYRLLVVIVGVKSLLDCGFHSARGESSSAHGVELYLAGILFAVELLAEGGYIAYLRAETGSFSEGYEFDTRDTSVFVNADEYVYASL